jgi:GMP synthase (glutamine-hydrolysing)
MNPEVIVLQHVACEHLGSIAEALASEQLQPRYVRVDLGESVPATLGDAAGLIVMGGPMSVYEQDRLPHLRDELRLLESALREDRPILGVCLGSQLLAAALGAKVYPGVRKEIGWYDVSLTPAATHDALWNAAPAIFPAFHWHGDQFDLPTDATWLASSAITPHQAFRYGSNAYGILFHMEVQTELVEAMLRSFADEVQACGGSEITIRSETTKYLPSLHTIGQTIYRRWAKLCLPE